MDQWVLAGKQEGTGDDAASPLCGRALAEQGDGG